MTDLKAVAALLERIAAAVERLAAVQERTLEVSISAIEAQQRRMDAIDHKLGKHMMIGDLDDPPPSPSRN